MKNKTFKALFLDIGNVILTNGWDHGARERAAKKYGLDLEEMNKRHGLTFDTYEIGKITLDVYLDRVIFYTPRTFSREDFKQFMFEQSQSFPEMIKLIKETKNKYALKVVAVSNEGKELMDYRIEKFQLKEIIDFFVCSGFIGIRKPDYSIYQMAIDLSQVLPEEIVYIDDRPLLAEIGSQMGFSTISHVNATQTKECLKQIFEEKYERQS